MKNFIFVHLRFLNRQHLNKYHSFAPILQEKFFFKKMYHRKLYFNQPKSIIMKGEII